MVQQARVAPGRRGLLPGAQPRDRKRRVEAVSSPYQRRAASTARRGPARRQALRRGGSGNSGSRAVSAVDERPAGVPPGLGGRHADDGPSPHPPCAVAPGDLSRPGEVRAFTSGWSDCALRRTAHALGRAGCALGLSPRKEDPQQLPRRVRERCWGRDLREARTGTVRLRPSAGRRCSRGCRWPRARCRRPRRSRWLLRGPNRRRSGTCCTSGGSCPAGGSPSSR